MPVQELPLINFHQTVNQDDIYAPGCIASRFIRCTPHRNLGIVQPNALPTNATNDLSSFSAAGNMTAMWPYTRDRIFVCSSSGDIYELDLDGTPAVTNVHTRAPAAGSANCYNMMYFNGVIYYAMEDRLGSYTIATNTYNDNFATFTRGTSQDLHPMRIVNDTLYIGDSDLLAQVDSTGAFTANALDVEPDFEITCLGEANNQILIGTRSKRNGTTFNEPKHSYSKVYRWNTSSVSFDTAVRVPEDRIAAFLTVEGGGIYMLTMGAKIKIYGYGEPDPGLLMELPTGVIDMEPSRQMVFYPMCAHTYAGVTYFALGDIQSTAGYSRGIYSFRAKEAGVQPTVQLEYSFSGYAAGDNPEFYCVASLPNTMLLWSWKQTANAAIKANGVDYVSTISSVVVFRNYEIWTGVLRDGRLLNKDFRVWVPMAIMGLTTTAVLTAVANGGIGTGATTTMINLVKDDQRNMFYTDRTIPPCASLQLQVSITEPSAGVIGSAVEGIYITFE